MNLKTILKNVILFLGICLYFYTITFNPKDSLIFYVISYFIIGSNVLLTAIKNIKSGLFLDENFLMSIATIGAFAIGEYSEAVAVMLFYFVGETLQNYAVDNSRRAIKEAMNIVPEFANLKKDGIIEKVSPKKVNIGEVILIKAGERVPLDGIVIQGSSSLDTSALTGESKPVTVKKDSKIFSGSLNINGLIEVQVTQNYRNSTVSKILSYIQDASDRKATIEKFMTKFSRYYTPVIMIIALAVFIIPGTYTGDYKTWVYRALLFLVISCPCALVVSIPLGVFSGIGSASRNGILVKGGNYLEVLGKVKNIVFDKTGTLTQGNFKVIENTVPEKIGKIVSAIEQNSNHPIALSIVEYYGHSALLNFDNFEEISGMGMKATYKGKEYLIGNSKLLKKYDIKISEEKYTGTPIYVAVDNSCVGIIVIGDSLREGSKKLIKELKKLGIKSHILSGDKNTNVIAIAKELGIDGEVFAELLPGEKMEKYEFIKANMKGSTAFVGDGINDAPVLRLADVGISLGGIGSDAALEAADIVIMDNSIEKISKGIDLSKKVERILYQNVGFSLGIKIIIMFLGVIGYASMWLAVFADVGVALIAVLNAMRILKNR